MSATPNLGLAHLLPSQAQKDVTVNQALDGLDEAVAGTAAIDVSAGGTFTLSYAQWINLRIELTGSPSAATQIVVPLSNPKLYLVDNRSSKSSTIAGATGTGISVAASAIQLVYCDGTNVIAAATSSAGGLTSVAGTANQILATTIGSTVTLSLIGPYTPATFSAHGVLLGQGTSSITASVPGAAGTVLTSAGPSADPIWSAPATGVVSIVGTANQIQAATASGTVTLSLIGPYTPATYSAHGVLLGQGTSAITASVPGAAGTVLTSAGPSADPVWSAPGAASSVVLNAGGGSVTLAAPGSAFTNYTLTFPAGAPAQGALMYFSNATGMTAGLADVAAGAVMVSGGVGVVPAWSNTPTLGVAGSTRGTLTLANTGAGGSVTLSPNSLSTSAYTFSFPGSAPAANTLMYFSNSTGGTAAMAAGQQGQVLAYTNTGMQFVNNPTLGVAGSLLGSLGLTTSTASAGIVTLQAASLAFSSYTFTFPPGPPSNGSVMVWDTFNRMNALADVAAGSYFRSAGVGIVPVWSTLTLPNAATQGDLMMATAANTVGSLADVAAGSYLRSGGVSAVPVWSTLTLPNAATQGDIIIATASNVLGSLVDVAVGQALVSGGVGAAPAWSSNLFLSGTSLGLNETALQGVGIGSVPMIEVFGGTNIAGLSLAASPVASGTTSGAVVFSTSGTAQADKRAIQLSGRLAADSTTVPWGYLSISLAQGGVIGEKFRVGHALAPGTLGSNWVELVGANSNILAFAALGSGVPGQDSAGEKIQLVGTAGTVAPGDYAIGLSSARMWFNVAQGGDWGFYENSALAGPQQAYRLSTNYPSGGALSGDVLSMGRSIGSYSVANLPSYAQVIKSATPGAYWRLDEASGNFTDSSGNSNTGTANGTITYGAGSSITHDNDYAITLDGSTAYITVAAAASLPSGDTFSLNFAVKRSATQGTKQYIMCQKVGGFGVYFDTDNTIALEKVGTGLIVKSTVTFTSTSAFAYLHIIKNGATSSQIISSQSDVSGTVSNQTIAPADSSLWLGSDYNGANLMPGSLDEVALWSSASTMAQVVARSQELGAIKLGRIAWTTDGQPTNPIAGGAGGCFAVYARFGSAGAGHPNLYGWQGHLPFSVNRYNADYVVGDLFYASAAGTISSLPAVATGSVLASQGAAAAPAWSATPALTSLSLSRQLLGAISALTYGTTVTPSANNGMFQTVSANTSTAFTIANPSPAFSTGAIWLLQLNNTSAGALGAISWGAAYRQGTVTAPAAGKSRIFAFYYDGTSHWKLFETADDL